jgi:hypothetical protein
MYEIQRMTTRQRHEQQARTYWVLIDIAEEVVGNVRAGLDRTPMIRGKAGSCYAEFRAGIRVAAAIRSIMRQLSSPPGCGGRRCRADGQSYQADKPVAAALVNGAHAPPRGLLPGCWSAGRLSGRPGTPLVNKGVGGLSVAVLRHHIEFPLKMTASARRVRAPPDHGGQVGR